MTREDLIDALVEAAKQKAKLVFWTKRKKPIKLPKIKRKVQWTTGVQKTK